MKVIAYLKQQCGWSGGIREVLAKCGVEYEEKQINIPEHFQEMVEKTGQTLQPCVQFGNTMLVDISGEELLEYLVDAGHPSQIDSNVPLDAPCTEEEHAEMQKMPTGSINVDLVHRVIDVEVEKPALPQNVDSERSNLPENIRKNEKPNTKATTGGSQPHIPIKDTGFYGAR